MTPEAIEIVGQTKQKSLFALRGKRTARSTGGEFALDRAEESFGMHPLPIRLRRKGRSHLCTHSVQLPTGLASFGWNDALCPELPTDVPVVSFTIKLGVVQYGSYGVAGRSDFIEQRTQRSAVIDWSLVRSLRQDQAALGIDGQKPFEPVTPWHRRAPMLFAPSNKKRANRTRSQPGCIHRHSWFFLLGQRPAPLQTAHHFGQSLSDDLFIQAQHETKESAVIRHGFQFQRAPQLRMLLQADLGCTKGPILVTHQTQNRQQLRLGKTLRRKPMTVRRQNLSTDFQCDSGKRHQSNFTHAFPIYTQQLIVQVPFQQC